MGKCGNLHLFAVTSVTVMLALCGLVLVAAAASRQSLAEAPASAAMRNMQWQGSEPVMAASLDSSQRSESVSSVVTVTVGSDGLRFSPDTVAITAGTTVRWVWVAGLHTVTSGSDGVADDRFCSPNDQDCSTVPALGAGSVYEHTFMQPGVYPYFCRLHYTLGMTGTISVTPAATTTVSVFLPAIMK